MDDGNVANRVDWALRTGCSVLFAAVIKSVIPSSQLPAFGTFVAVLALERNIGRTVANVRACVIGSAISAALCALWLTLFREFLVAMHAANALSAYLLARWTSLPTLAQKVGLSMLPFTLINGFNPGGRQDLAFPLELFFTVLLGCGCAAAASVIPLPHFGPRLGLRVGAARSRLVESRNSSLELLGLLLQSLVRAFCADPTEKHWRSRVRRDAMGKALQKEAELISMRAADAAWEPLLALCCCIRDPDYAFDDASMSEALLEVVKGLCVAEEAIVDHSAIGGADEYLQYLKVPMKASLDAIARLLETLKVSPIRTEEEGARPVAARSERIRQAAYSCMGAQRTLQAEYRRGRQEIRRAMRRKPLPITHDLLLSLNVFLFYYTHTADSIVLLAQDAVRDNTEARMSMPQRFLQSARRAVAQLATELTGTFRTFNPWSDLRMQSAASQSAWKIMLAMILAAAFDATKGREDPPPALAGFTVAYIGLGPTLRDSVVLSKLRLGGTVAGGIFASVVLGLPGIRENPAVLITLLAIFAVGAGYVRGSLHASYAGTVAAFTAPTLMLSFNDPSTRTEHTFVGIVIYVTIDLLLFNTPSAIRAHRALSSTLSLLEESVCALYAGFGPEPVAKGESEEHKEGGSPRRPILTPRDYTEDAQHAEETQDDEDESSGKASTTVSFKPADQASDTGSNAISDKALSDDSDGTPDSPSQSVLEAASPGASNPASSPKQTPPSASFVPEPTSGPESDTESDASGSSSARSAADSDREGQEARWLLQRAAARVCRVDKVPIAGEPLSTVTMDHFRVEARRLLAKTSTTLEMLKKLVAAAEVEPRFLRPTFPSKYMGEAVENAVDVESNLSLALTAFAALERRMARSRAPRGLEVEDETAPLTHSLVLRRDEDPTFTGLLRPLGGPMAVFAAELTVTLRAASVDAELLLQDAPTPGGFSHKEEELAAYCIPSAASEAAFLKDYDRVCKQLAPNRDTNPQQPYMSNVEIEAVNAVVFCLMQAMRASHRLGTAVGELSEYDFLYSRQSAGQQRTFLDRFRLQSFTNRLLSAMHFLAPLQSAAEDARDPEAALGKPSQDFEHWALQRQARLRRRGVSSQR